MHCCRKNDAPVGLEEATFFEIAPCLVVRERDFGTQNWSSWVCAVKIEDTASMDIIVSWLQ